MSSQLPSRITSSSSITRAVVQCSALVLLALMFLCSSPQRQVSALRTVIPVAVTKHNHLRRFHQSQQENNMATLEFSKERAYRFLGQESFGKIDLLYDSECPICAMEVEFLRKRDIYSRIKFTDLQSPTYNPSEHGNVDFERGMRKIRAVLPDASVVTGVEVFRRTYEAIGLGWVFALTQLPVIGDLADAAYDFWAEHRLRLTGRGDLADVVRAKADELRELDPIDECSSDACELDWDAL